jgi:hypothetical protein
MVHVYHSTSIARINPAKLNTDQLSEAACALGEERFYMQQSLQVSSGRMLKMKSKVF